jgi:Ca2+-binding EF-hand superfamily protein
VKQWTFLSNLQARQEAMSAKSKALLNSLFEMWDNDGSGYLELEEIESVMKKYKEGMEKTIIAEGL